MLIRYFSAFIEGITFLIIIVLSYSCFRHELQKVPSELACDIETVKLKPPLFSKMEKLSLLTISELCMELTQSWGVVWQVSCRTWEALFRASHGLAVKEADAV